MRWCTWCALVMVSTGTIVAQSITISAFDSRWKKDAVWENRDGAMGIVGNHRSTSGTMSMAFPNNSGTYKVVFNVVLERDGQPKYKISAGATTLKSGSYPYACGSLMCTATKEQCPDKSSSIDCGTHTIKKGDNIAVWGQSVYPCGSDHGSYCRWKSLAFTWQGATSVSNAPVQLERGGKVAGPSYTIHGVKVPRKSALCSGVYVAAGADGVARVNLRTGTVR